VRSPVGGLVRIERLIQVASLGSFGELASPRLAIVAHAVEDPGSDGEDLLDGDGLRGRASPAQ